MSFLPNLDRDWREKEPDDIWFESFLHASGPHRKLIHGEMQRCQLTIREATQKVYKCDPESAEQDIIPPRWNTLIIQHARQREINQIFGRDTFQELIDATSADPDSFDSEIGGNR